MQTNTKGHMTRTYEGAVARRDAPLTHLKQVLNAHMLWEDSFYVDGKTSVDVLSEAVESAAKCNALATGNAIIDARVKMNLRHAPLYAAALYAVRGHRDARDLVFNVVQRADEMAEIIAMAKGLTESGKLPSGVKKGVADAFGRFDEYQLGKYKGGGRSVTLRDVVRLTHPDAPLAKKVVDDALEIPNTWETRLSAGEDKAKVFRDLLSEGKLGAMALLRNLRNMEQAGVERGMIRYALMHANWGRVLPFRFMTAAITAPAFAADLDMAFRKAVATSPFIAGKTAVMVDTSGSMHAPISQKSMVMRHWAGACLAAAINGDHVDLWEWANEARQVPRWGSLADALSLETGRVGHGTDLVRSLPQVLASKAGYDRVIVLSDMQFRGVREVAPRSQYGLYGNASVPTLPAGVKGYTINLAAYANPGLTRGDWTHLSGFSDKVLNWISEEEAV